MALQGAQAGQEHAIPGHRLLVALQGDLPLAMHELGQLPQLVHQDRAEPVVLFGRSGQLDGQPLLQRVDELEPLVARIAFSQVSRIRGVFGAGRLHLGRAPPRGGLLLGGVRRRRCGGSRGAIIAVAEGAPQGVLELPLSPGGARAPALAP